MISWFICKFCECNTSYRRRLGRVSSVWTNPKRLSEGVRSSSPSPILSILLPTMTSKLCFLSTQWRTYPPSMPRTVKEPSGRGKSSHSLVITLDTTRLALTQLCFESLRHRERVIAHGFHVQAEIKRQKVLECIETQPVGHQRGPLGSSLKRSSRATGSVSRADSGRNDAVFRRLQSQCSSPWMRDQCSNKVRNERLPWALSWSGVPQSGHVACVSRKVVTCCWRRCRWRVLRSCLDLGQA